MRYRIFINHNSRKYKLILEHIPVDERREHFKVEAANKTLIIESNRPFWRNKGLKHRKYDLKLIEGHVANMSFVYKINDAIADIVTRYLEGLT